MKPNVRVFDSHQCTCNVLAENSMDSADYYITKVVLETPSEA